MKLSDVLSIGAIIAASAFGWTLRAATHEQVTQTTSPARARCADVRSMTALADWMRPQDSQAWVKFLVVHRPAAECAGIRETIVYAATLTREAERARLRRIETGR